MAFRFDKLTQKAQEAVQQAQQMAAENGHQAVHPLHLLLALTAEREGIVRPVSKNAGLQPDGVEHEAQRQIATPPQGHRPARRPVHLAPGFSRSLIAAAKSAESFKDEFVSTEHLLLGIADQKYDPAGSHPESSGRHQRRHPQGPRGRARHPARYRSESGEQISGARAVTPSILSEQAKTRQARSCHRPRR